MKEKAVKQYIIWGILIFLFLLMHVYRIGQIPYGINVDEMGMGYDAWCLAHFGTDRYQNSFPVYLINFSGGQSALYAYLCAPFVYFWGMNAVVFRIPAVLCSAITCYFSIKTAGLLFGEENRRIKMLVWFLYDIFPVFTMLFRIGLDCNLMLGVSSVFFYLFMAAIKRQETSRFFVAGLFGGLMLYSYVLSHLVLPIFLTLSVIYLWSVRKIKLKQLLALGAPIFVMAVPLMLMHFINHFGLPEFTLGIFTVPKLYRYRSDDMASSYVSNNVRRFARSTLIYDGIKSDSIERFGTIYRISIPFLVIGIASGIKDFVQSIRTKECNVKCLFLFWITALFCIGITLESDGPSVYRMNAIYLAYLLLTTEGILLTYHMIKRYSEKVGKILTGVLLAVYSASFIFFATYYFTDYTDDTYLLSYFDFMLNEPLAYLDELPESVSNRTTYIGNMPETYIYFLGSTETAPQEYNELVDDKPYTLYLWMLSFGKYHFEIPETVDPAANYIVPETDSESNALLNGHGLERVLVGRHYVYINTWLDYQGENCDCVISYDHGLDENGLMILDGDEKTVLSGWAFNQQDGKIWDDIVVEAGGLYYTAEKMERKDVADLLGDDSFRNCGFHATLDMDAVRSADRVKVICIDYGNEACFVQEIPTGVGAGQ